MAVKKTLTGIAVGASLIIGGGTVDLVPVNLPAVAWSQYRAEEAPVDAPAWTENTATGTIDHPAYIAPKFTDDDGDGLISYAIAINKKGEKVYTQIPEIGYKTLGTKNGFIHNLEYQAVDHITLAEAIIDGITAKTAEAAIAHNASDEAKYTACVTGTSCTYSFTNNSGNLVIADTTDFGNPPVNPGATTMTYGGNAMTSMSGGTAQFGTQPPGAYHETFYLVNAPTGANNLVITTTGSMTNGFYAHAISYSGAGSIRNITTQTTGNIGSDSCSVTIGDTTNSWAGWFGITGIAGRTYSAGANTTNRAGADDSQTHVYDSGGIANSSPWTMNATISVGTEVKVDTCFEIVMASTVVNTQNNGCRGELHGTLYCDQ